VQEVRLLAATTELEAAQATLDEKEAELRKVQDIYDAAMTEKQELLDDAENCKRKMNAASQLINGLAGEKIRWTNQSKEFLAEIDR
jgi:dynein heavy chain